MLTKANNFVEEAKKLRRLCIEELADGDSFTNENPRAILAIQSLLKLFDQSCDMLTEQATTIDEMNQKLDRILCILNKG